jgi:hypothetical protein
VDLQWKELGLFEIPGIGVKVSGTDLTLVGGPSLYVLMAWLWFVLRAEKRSVKRVLDHASKLGPEERAKALAAIEHYFVLTDTPNELDEPKFIRQVIRALAYGPAAAMTLVVLVDVPTVLYRNLGGVPGLRLSPGDVIEYCGRTVWCIGWVIGLWVISKQCRALDKATADCLKSERVSRETPVAGEVDDTG